MGLFLTLILAAGETRRVVVEPGFAESEQRVEIDHTELRPGERAAIVRSTRNFAGRKTQLAAEYQVGTRLWVVFSPLGYGPKRHSVADFTVEAGDGTQTVTATPSPPKDDELAYRAVTSEAADTRLSDLRLLMPVPGGLALSDQRQDDAQTAAPVGFWAVPVGGTRRATNERPAPQAGPLAAGQSYLVTAVAPGHAPADVRLQRTGKGAAVELTPLPPLRLRFRSPTGTPIVGVRVWVRESFPPGQSARGYFPVMRSHGLPGAEPVKGEWPGYSTPNATSDDDGRVSPGSLLGGESYDLYADAGGRGRAAVGSLRLAEDHTVTLAPAPPLRVSVKGTPGGRLTVQERIDDSLSISNIAHGPFPIDADGTATVEVPMPLSDEMSVAIAEPDE